MKTRPLAFLLFLAVVLGACGGSGENHAAHSGGGTQETQDPMNMQGRVPGSAADPSEAETEILITASDGLKFDPDEIELSAGDVVTFVIRNDGKIDHEFVLGDEEYQTMHEEDMAEDHDMSDMSNSVSVGPGERAELTWLFDEAGEIMYGCHEPGHYDGGMVGTIEIE